MKKLILLGLFITSNCFAITANEVRTITIHSTINLYSYFRWCKSSVEKQIITSAKKGNYEVTLILPNSCYKENNLNRLVDYLEDNGFITDFTYPYYGDNTFIVRW